MDKKIKKEWLKALRSGDYKQQRRGELEIDGCYCCLGVLREASLTDKEGHDEDSIGELSYPQLEEAGLDAYQASTLMLMNDDPNDGKTFLEIANYIEKEL